MKTVDLENLFAICQTHQNEHQCGGYPYHHADVLVTLIAATKAKRILELGTGLGYTAAAMTLVDTQIHIDTIDQDGEHSELALQHWEALGISKRITQYVDKAEAVLPTLSPTYDLIFFDGYAPSMKFMVHFDRLLLVGGVLVSANLFVKDQRGGKYVRELKRDWKWQSGFFSDSAISVKLR